MEPAFFRPSYGLVTGAPISAAHRAGLELVLWSAWGREWTDRDADSVARRVVSRLNPGTIVLLHDSDVGAPPGSAARARQALGPVSDALARRGLSAVTMSELISE